MAKAVGRRAGAQSKYEDGFNASFSDIARKLALLGATDVQMAKAIGVARSTLNVWRDKRPEFAQAIQQGKLIADSSVAEALYRRAIGYEHEETDIRVIDGQIVKTPITKRYPPDSTACIYWTKNRARWAWRDKVEAGLTDGEGNDVKPVDPLELARGIAFLLAKAAA